MKSYIEQLSGHDKMTACIYCEINSDNNISGELKLKIFRRCFYFAGGVINATLFFLDLLYNDHIRGFAAEYPAANWNAYLLIPFIARQLEIFSNAAVLVFSSSCPDIHAYTFSINIDMSSIFMQCVYLGKFLI